MSRVDGGCPCTSIRPQAFGLKPGERINLNIVFDLESQTRQFGAISSAPFSSTLLVYADGNEGAPIARWTTKGRARRAFFTTPDRVSFGETLVVGSPYVPKTVAVTCYERCRGLDVAVDGKYGAATTMDVGHDGRHFELLIAPNASLGVGQYNFTVAVSAVLASGEHTPPVHIPVEARILQDIHVVPALAHFGDLALGAVREEWIVVSSRQGLAFDVLSYKASTSDLKVIAEEQESPLYRVYRVTLRSSKLGSQDSEVRFRIRNAQSVASRNGQTAEIVFSARYFGSQGK